MSKIKNIVVTKFYTVKDHSKWYSDRTNEANMESAYEDMIVQLQDSAKRFCVGMDEFVCHTGEVSDIREAFVVDFFKIKELWEKQKCNILYLDADTYFTRPVEIFGKFDTFRMFNYTDPRSLKTDEYDFPHFFNCGIRYYPHDMSADVWDIGAQAFENMDRTHWDEEQRIYNKMMWSQDLTIMDTLYPEFAYQMLSGKIMSETDFEFNGIPIMNAGIVHLHGSRDASSRAQTQLELRMLALDERMCTWMRFGHRVSSGSSEKFYVDKQFRGTSQTDLQHQIKRYMMKYGACEAFNVELKENHEES